MIFWPSRGGQPERPVSQRPPGLPLRQSTKRELVINLKTAQTLGLAIPEMLLSTEVIE
jgi:hypothetical protein